MSFEPGGRADKLGNRYENWWLAKQLLRVVNEEVQSLTLEPVGPDEVGTEFWLDFQNGYREAHQCKARNADKDKWTISDLKHNDVLKNTKYQLERDQNLRFVFVSAISSISLSDICDVARNSNNPSDFYNYQIKKRGESVRKTFGEYCQAMELNPDTPKDLNMIHDYLKRTEVIHFSDDRNHLGDVLRFADMLFNSSPQKVLSLLFSYAIERDKLGKPITANALINYLKENEIYPRNLVLDTRIQSVIDSLQKAYLDSIQPYLINKRLINRTETKECLRVLEENGFIMLTGDSGAGKSSVLYELTMELEEKAVNYLPIRLDHQVPKGTAQQFGEDLNLPASPILCIEGISIDEPVVVIIDQLDSIRWTSTHSTNALEVCKELIRQIIHFKREGRNISLIVACRSFDLNYDAELLKWFTEAKEKDQFKWTEIQVSPLSTDQIKKVVGQNYDFLNRKQQQLLMNPQNLYVWTELDENKSDFISSIDLLTKFWKTKALAIEKEKVSRSEFDSIINKLVDFMERRGVISAPSRIIRAESELAKQALKSHGILLAQGKKIRFSHQSYLDYLIAGRVIDLIDEGESILDWLGDPKSQTLFRREQLRQALSMMIEEDSLDLLTAVKDILRSESVRFHLKHLVLEVVGHYKKLDGEIEHILLDLLYESKLKMHVLDTVFLRNKSATEMLLDREIIQSWVDMEKEEEINISIHLLSSVKQSSHPEIIKVLTKIIEQDSKWEEPIINSLGWDIENDSEDIFRLRLQMAEKGIYSGFMDWKESTNLSAMRVIMYIKALLKSIESPEEPTDKNNNLARIERWYKNDLKRLSKMTKKFCLEVWDHLIPEINRLYMNYDKYTFTMDDSEPYSISSGTVKLLIEAGKRIAKKHPNEFLERISSYKNSDSIFIQRIIIESFQEIDSEYSDAAVAWFIDNPDIITYSPIGWSRFKISREFIKSLSRICSDEAFKKLEKFIIMHQSEYMVEVAKRSFDYRRNGDYPPYWGEIQYLLLSQLDQSRISKRVKDLLIVLNRRYNGQSPESLANMFKTSGGVVGSTLNKNLNKISDNSWIDIITNDNVPTDSRSQWNRSKVDGSLVETSVGQFSSSLRRAAEENPERFGRMGVERLPKDIHSLYLSSLLSALGLLEPPWENIDNWKSADSDTVLDFIIKYSERLENREVAIEFCRLMRSREDIEWPLSIIKLLEEIACEHPDPQINSMNVYPMDWDKDLKSLSPDDLFSNSINCVRGVAADAIQLLLFRRPDLFAHLEKAINSLVQDGHPSVRTGVIGMLLPIINIDRDKAVQWFVKAVKDDYRVMCTNYGMHFLNYTVKTHQKAIKGILKNMIVSNNETVVKFGSKAIVGYNIIYGFFDEYTSNLLKGNIVQKKGAIKAATQLIEDKKYAYKCRKILFPIIEQNDPNLREEMSKLLRIDIHEIDENKEIIISLIGSQYFDDIDVLIHNLYQYEGEIISFADFIISMCKEINENHTKEAQEITSLYNYVARKLFKLVLRLYEEADLKNNEDILNCCLDVLDEFFIKRIGTVRELTRIIEGT